jgi:hypothetical protein
VCQGGYFEARADGKWDCADTEPDANPAQTGTSTPGPLGTWFFTPHSCPDCPWPYECPTCSFDWNCDGVESKSGAEKFVECTVNSSETGCNEKGWYYLGDTSPECGGFGLAVCAFGFLGDTPVCTVFGGLPQSCL